MNDQISNNSNKVTISNSLRRLLIVTALSVATVVTVSSVYAQVHHSCISLADSGAAQVEISTKDSLTRSELGLKNTSRLPVCENGEKQVSWYSWIFSGSHNTPSFHFLDLLELLSRE